MYIIIDDDNGGIVTGCSESDLTKYVVGHVEFVEDCPADVVGTTKYIDGEFVANED